MKNLKKLKKEELKKVLGGMEACNYQLCFRNGKWICVPYDTCGGFQP